MSNLVIILTLSGIIAITFYFSKQIFMIGEMLGIIDQRLKRIENELIRLDLEKRVEFLESVEAERVVNDYFSQEN